MKKLIQATTAALIAISVFTGCSDDGDEAPKKAAGAVTSVSTKSDALTPGDSVKIEFTCVAGEHYDIDVDYDWSHDDYLDYYVYGPSGAQVNSSFTAEEGGTYYVVIKASTDNTSNITYKFTADKIQISNEVYGKWFTSYEMETETWINESGERETDVYEVSYANIDDAGDVYEITKDYIYNYYRERNGLSISTGAEMYSIANFAELAEAQIVNGTIVLQDSESLGGESWSYKEVYSRYNGDVPPPNWKDETASKPSTTESISLGETKNGSISDFTDTKWYKVSLKQDDKVHFEITDATYDTYMVLTDSEGNEVTYNDDYVDLLSAIDYACTADGDYYVVVTAYSGSGSYSLEMNSDYDESNVDGIYTEEIVYGRSADKKKRNNKR